MFAVGKRTTVANGPNTNKEKGPIEVKKANSLFSPLACSVAMHTISSSVNFLRAIAGEMKLPCRRAFVTSPVDQSMDWDIIFQSGLKTDQSVRS